MEDQNQPEDWQESSKRKKPSKAYLKYSGMAFQMISIMLIFLFLGKYLDRQFLTEPILTVVFVILGVFLAIAFFMIQILKEK